MTDFREEAERLVEERAEARDARDFGRADELRERIRRLGWVVVDGPQGPSLESMLDRVERYAQLGGTRSRLGTPDTHQFSLCLAMAGWPEDVRRLIAALADPALPPDRIEVLVVDQARQGLKPRDLAPTAGLGGLGLRVLRVEDEEIGHAQAWTLGAHQAGGRILAFSEPSLEFESGALDALDGVLADRAVGLAGPFGLRRKDEGSFEAADGVAVDALEYLLALRRAEFGRIGDFDAQYRFYRILDIDYCYQARAAGFEVRAVPELRVARHRHRLWEAAAPEERDRLSRRNFSRFLQRWGRTEART